MSLNRTVQTGLTNVTDRAPEYNIETYNWGKAILKIMAESGNISAIQHYRLLLEVEKLETESFLGLAFFDNMGELYTEDWSTFPFAFDNA